MADEHGNQGNQNENPEVTTEATGVTLEGVADREHLSGVKFLQTQEHPGDLTVVLQDGSTVVIPNYLVLAQAGLPPTITLADGTVIPGQEILTFIPDLNLDEIAPAAGVVGPNSAGAGAAFLGATFLGAAFNAGTSSAARPPRVQPTRMANTTNHVLMAAPYPIRSFTARTLRRGWPLLRSRRGFRRA